MGAGSGASWVDSGGATEPSLRGAIFGFGVYSDDITDETFELTLTLPHPVGTSGSPGTTTQPSLLEVFIELTLLDRSHWASLPS